MGRVATHSPLLTAMAKRPSNLDRLRSYERRHRHADVNAWRNESYRYGDYRLQEEEANTLGPQEDVVENRRIKRQHVAMQHAANNGGSPIFENLTFLGLLIGSVYGLFRIAVYLLSQS